MDAGHDHSSLQVDDPGCITHKLLDRFIISHVNQAFVLDGQSLCPGLCIVHGVDPAVMKLHCRRYLR